MKPSSKQQCLADLRRRILILDIKPGSDLDEIRLCDQYGLSRTPLREVLQKLAGEGYVSVAANRGAKVASMDFPVMRAFFQSAPMIYSAMGRLAAENRRDSQLDELRDVQHQFAAAVAAGAPPSMVIHNNRFHEIIGEMAGNDYLMPSLKRLLIDHARLSQTFYRPAMPTEIQAVGEACAQHDAMIDAIAEQNAKAMVHLTLQHWALSRDRMESFVRPDPLPDDVREFWDKRHAV